LTCAMTLSAMAILCMAFLPAGHEQTPLHSFGAS
jgi:hypothetical protein